MRHDLAHQLEVDGASHLLPAVRGLGVRQSGIGLVDAQISLLPVAAHMNLASALLLQPALQRLRLLLRHCDLHRRRRALLRRSRGPEAAGEAEGRLRG